MIGEKQATRAALEEIYRRLFDRFGPQAWWPGRTRFEIMVGAILTQNTNWGNVEQAIRNLKKEGLLNPIKLREIPLSKLARLIRPSGYYNIKARRLKNFVDFLFKNYNGRLDKMAAEPLPVLREKMLAVNGIGPETADSILLYACGKTIFVVDAYTRRVFQRHSMIDHSADYHAVQKIFMDKLAPDPVTFNEYHALIVRLGKEFCRPRPACGDCPLKDLP